jgi:hypothetical protein
MAVAHRLTDRDRMILSMLYRHRVFTTDQFGAMVVANEQGEDPDRSRWRADKALAIGKSQRLRPLVLLGGPKSGHCDKVQAAVPRRAFMT